MEIIRPKSARGQSVAVSHVRLHVCVSEDYDGSGGSLFNELTLILLTVSLPSLTQSHSLYSTSGEIPCDIISPDSNKQQTTQRNEWGRGS